MPYRIFWPCLALLGFCLGNPVTCNAYEPVVGWEEIPAPPGARRYRLKYGNPYNLGFRPDQQPVGPRPLHRYWREGDRINVSPPLQIPLTLPVSP